MTLRPKNNRLVINLYRSLLRATTPFSRPPHGKVLCSLLYRRDVFDWGDALPTELEVEHTAQNTNKRFENAKTTAAMPSHLPQQYARNLSMGYNELKEMYHKQQKVGSISDDDSDDDNDDNDDDYFGNEFEFHKILVMKLWREAFNATSGGYATLYRFPSQINLDNGQSLRDFVRREFRLSETANVSKDYTPQTRIAAAFVALKILNEKLNWISSKLKFDYSKRHSLETKATSLSRRAEKAAKGVSSLPLYPPSSYLRPGAYLVAHPLLQGYFSRSVILILDHNDKTRRHHGGGAYAAGGTYGLIVNRQSGGAMENVLRAEVLPDPLRAAFGRCRVRDGGPVNPSVQMLHVSSPEVDAKFEIGGHVIPAITAEEEMGLGCSSPALESDNAVYFKGDLMKASRAVVDGNLPREHFSFYVGASCWDIGQLESEIEQGLWIPASGPPKMALLGQSETNMGGGDDLWLSMMCALGEDDGDLAHLLRDDDSVQGCKACDDF